MFDQRSQRRTIRRFWDRLRSRPGGYRYRRPSFETLESRQLLAITFPAIADQTVLAGAPLHIALNGVESEGHDLVYTVAVSDANLTNASVTNPELAAAIPTGNPSMRIVVNDAADGITNGTMVLELFEDLVPETVGKITSLVDEGFYDGLTFHRVITNFMIQGGDPNGDGSGGPGFEFDDQFDPSLQFTSAGVLAMANSGSDTNGSQFFITTVPTRWLDFRYTIFGFLTEGGDVLESIEAVETGSSDKPLNTVTMTSVTAFTDTQNGVLRLAAPNGTTGTAEVTVTATDSVTGDTATRTFQVTVAADSTAEPPYLGGIDPIETTAGTPVTFTIPAVNVDGLTLTYSGSVIPANSNLALSVNSSTGVATLTPAAGASGVYSIKLGVASASAVNTNPDTQLVPVYISPAAPTGVDLLPAYDTGASNSDNLTNLNNTAGKTLQFEVSGVTSGATVELFADGVLIGSATASGTTVVITTNGTATLGDGEVAITAKQTLEDQQVSVGNLSTTVDLASEASAALSIVVATAGPEFNFTPVTTAREGVEYTCQVTTAASAADPLAYALTEAPSGMMIGASTGLITWTPAEGEEATVDVTVAATDAAGNSSSKSYTISVAGANTAAPVLTPAAPSLGTTDENTAKTIALSTFINGGAGTTTIADADGDAVLGGIALTAATGNGTWAFSTDGSTYTPVGTVSPNSALLVPAGATLRYTPDGKNGETARITYRAWDATSGTSGAKVDTTTSGGATAFSTATDTASLTVTSVNDAPVLTGASPSLGTTAPGVAKTIALSAFINGGTGTTTITDADTGAVVGGIALTATSGGGTWAYSTDGSTFTSVGTVSANSALLLPAGATLRYTPSASSSETATITYRAWDTTSGTSGSKVATTPNGGATAFSTATDTASLSVGAASLSGFVYIDNNNDGLRTRSDGQAHLGIAGVAVRLLVKGTDGAWTEVAGKSPVLTGSDGSYSFTGLAAGTYRIKEDGPANFLDGIDSLGTVSGTARGTVGEDSFEVVLAAGESGSEYNFGERGLRAGVGLLRFFLASSGSASQIIPQLNAAPVVDLAASVAGTGRTTTYPAGGAAVAIAASDATITDADSTVLASMTVTITNRQDGDAEVLAANTSGTSLVSTYSGGVLTITGAANLADYQAVLKTVKYSNTASSPRTGNRTIEVVVNDGVTNSAPAIATVAVATAPAGYSITAGDSLISASEATSTRFTFAGAQVGATYNYSVTSSGGGTAVTGSGTVSSATQQVTGINVSSLADGTLTYSVTLTDKSGNTGSAATATATLDKTAPAGYTITAGDSLVSASEATSTRFTFAGAEVGAQYSYTVTSSGGGAVLTGSGTVSSAAQQVTGIDVSSIPDGTLTYRVVLLDPAGNTGSAATATATLDMTAPAGYTITADDSVITAGEATATSFTFAGAEIGTMYSFTVTSSGGGTPVTGNGTVSSATQRVTGIDVSSLAGGTLTYSVTLTDTAGNTGSAATATATLDSAPLGYTITANDSLVNAVEAVATGFTFADAEVGATYSYTVTSSGGSAVISGSGTVSSATEQVTGIDVSSLADGTLTYSATLTDTSGNTGSAVTATATLDKTAPAGYSITADDSLIGASEAAAASFTFADAEVGATYSYTITSDAGGTPVSGSGTVSSATEQVTGIDVSSLPDGTLTFSVTLTDAAGNTGSAATATTTLDTTAPAGYSITADDSLIGASEALATSFTFADAEIGATYSYTVTSDAGGTPVGGSGTIASAAEQVTGIDVSSLPDGTLTFSATLTDAAGNTGSAATASATLAAVDAALATVEDWL
jgi:cyclophilin family peptidyl-prolyl cis-trans isomerase